MITMEAIKSSIQADSEMSIEDKKSALAELNAVISIIPSNFANAKAILEAIRDSLPLGCRAKSQIDNYIRAKEREFANDNPIDVDIDSLLDGFKVIDSFSDSPDDGLNL
ncbi:hypothetical protein [Streptococcus hyointestinalis]